jgi:hypothetical protein
MGQVAEIGLPLVFFLPKLHFNLYSATEEPNSKAGSGVTSVEQ